MYRWIPARSSPFMNENPRKTNTIQVKEHRKEAQFLVHGSPQVHHEVDGDEDHGRAIEEREGGKQGLTPNVLNAGKEGAPSKHSPQSLRIGAGLWQEPHTGALEEREAGTQARSV